MLISLHKQATTTPKIRAAIQASTEPAWVVAERYGISEQTVWKWRGRDSTEDRSHTPHRLQTTLTPAQEAVAVALRRTLLLPLDDLLSEEAFEYFSMRLAAHHAYSSTVLKKENFEHILEQSFLRAGIPATRADSMTERGADLKAGNVTLSLKTEAAKNLRADSITISKLMEAAWIKGITSTGDIPARVAEMVMPHFANYDRVFILRSYPDPQRDGPSATTSARYPRRYWPRSPT